ncbi:MAG: DUF937 domain-containing protein [Eubacteriales bacterium]|nr:DUF937 domain-containing protein [Eubacteriales bacterium]
MANATVKALLSSSSLKQLSAASGAESAQVKSLLTAALPQLIGSMQDNASTADGQQSLEKALLDHAKDDPSDVAAFLQNADMEDGAKILEKIFGSGNSTVQSGLAKKSGLTKKQTSSILSSIAPLLLTLLGNNLTNNHSSSSSSGGLLSVLTSALFGGNEEEEEEEKDDGFGLDDVASILLGSMKDEGDNTSDLVGSLIGNLLAGKTSEAKKPAAKKPAAKKKPAKKKPAAKKPAAKKPAAKKPTAKKD